MGKDKLQVGESGLTGCPNMGCEDSSLVGGVCCCLGIVSGVFWFMGIRVMRALPLKIQFGFGLSVTKSGRSSPKHSCPLRDMV